MLCISPVLGAVLGVTLSECLFCALLRSIISLVRPCAWFLSTLHMACEGSVMELSTCAQTAII